MRLWRRGLYFDLVKLLTLVAGVRDRKVGKYVASGL